jgi:molybdopterin converting factor small subunit
MQQYSGQRDLEMRLSADPQEAVDMIIERFQIPWSGVLEKSVRIFINKELLETYKKSGRRLAEGDRISFIPISGGG